MVFVWWVDVQSRMQTHVGAEIDRRTACVLLSISPSLALHLPMPEVSSTVQACQHIQRIGLNQIVPKNVLHMSHTAESSGPLQGDAQEAHTLAQIAPSLS